MSIFHEINYLFLAVPRAADPPDSYFAHRLSPGVLSCVKEGRRLRLVFGGILPRALRNKGGKPTGKSLSDCIF